MYEDHPVILCLFYKYNVNAVMCVQVTFHLNTMGIGARCVVCISAGPLTSPVYIVHSTHPPLSWYRYAVSHSLFVNKVELWTSLRVCFFIFLIYFFMDIL